MALLDPRLIEIEILSEADRATFGGGSRYSYQRTGTTTPEDRQREEALVGLATERALVSQAYLAAQTRDPNYTVDFAAARLVYQLLAPGHSSIPLRITQWGRLRLYRLREEILNRDRIRDEFGVLWAHRHWLPDLTVHLRSRQPGTPVSLLLLDVDHLKALNTELGNPGADKVLTGIFEELRDVVRPHEGYRLGGDEAGAILVGLALAEATKLGHELRRLVEAHAWSGLDIKTKPTVSVGVGTLTEDMDAADLYAAADRIRARAKVTRNAVEAAAIPEPR